MSDTAPLFQPAPPPPRARSRRLGTSVLGLLAAAVLAIGVNMLADRLLTRARIDLTSQRLYTLSDGTRQVLGGLTDPVTTAIAGLDLENVGYLLVGLFVVTFLVAVAYWRFGRVEQRWTARLSPPTG